MLDLGKKSQQIGAVLDIVTELAEQTNILSINATIEAVGAGESGKRYRPPQSDSIGTPQTGRNLPLSTSLIRLQAPEGWRLGR